MKLIIITAIKAYEDNIKNILKAAQISAFTYHDAIGCNHSPMQAIGSNWFASDMHHMDSVMFFAITQAPNASSTSALVTAFNQAQDSTSHIHLAIINTETTS